MNEKEICLSSYGTVSKGMGDGVKSGRVGKCSIGNSGAKDNLLGKKKKQQKSLIMQEKHLSLFAKAEWVRS